MRASSMLAALDSHRASNMTATTTTAQASTKEFLGHPAGLVNLFFTEMWERFSYYGMRALLMLYMVAPIAGGGLGWDTPRAAEVYGWYTMAVYLSSIPGGFIADKILGARQSIFWGGVIIALGHFTLAVPSSWSFYIGLCLIVMGTGMLKPNISSLLGKLYKDGDDRRDAGFSIFYMGINLGAMLSPLVCGYLAQDAGFKQWLIGHGIAPETSWHWGFGAAGVGMIIGLINFVLQRKMLGDAGGKPVRDSDGVLKEAPSVPTAEALEAEPPVSQPLTKDELKRIGAIGILFIFNIGFWAVYEQGGSSLNLFADRLTRNEVFGWAFPSSWFQAVQPALVILLAPVISWLWMRLGHKQPSSPAKFGYGLFFLGIGTLIAVPATMLSAAGKVSPMWLLSIYFLQTIGELCLSPVGLSTVTKLAPQRIVGMTMGVWFVSVALGNKTAGWLAGFFDDKNVAQLVNLFGGMGAACFVATILLVVLIPRVRKLMGGIR